MVEPDEMWIDIDEGFMERGGPVNAWPAPYVGALHFVRLTPALSALIEAAKGDINNESDFWMKVDSAVFALRKSIITAQALGDQT